MTCAPPQSLEHLAIWAVSRLIQCFALSFFKQLKGCCLNSTACNFLKKDQQIFKITGTRWINPLHGKFSEDLKKQIIWKLLDFVVVLCFNLIYLNLIFPKVVKSYLAYMIDPDIQLPLLLPLTIVTDSFKVWVGETCSNTCLSGWNPHASVKHPSQGAGGNALFASAVAPKIWKVLPPSTDHPAGVCYAQSYVSILLDMSFVVQAEARLWLLSSDVFGCRSKCRWSALMSQRSSGGH